MAIAGMTFMAATLALMSGFKMPRGRRMKLCLGGVGLYALAIVSTAFIGGALWVIESFEDPLRHFELKIKAGDDTDSLRPKIEQILRRYHLQFELRTSSDEEVCYDVQVPFEVQTDRVSNSILDLDEKGHAAVDWSEKKKNGKK